MVAVWGAESNFGQFLGSRPVIASLATLAYDSRRASFFRGELIQALTILDKGLVALQDFKGSWAGALGQPQFMPSSYLEARRGLRRRRQARHLELEGRRAGLDGELSQEIRLDRWPALGPRGRGDTGVQWREIEKTVPLRSTGMRRSESSMTGASRLVDVECSAGWA